jgi:hypothetical protein
VVSPRIAVVLRHNYLRPDVLAKSPSSMILNSDFLDLKPTPPIPTYADQRNTHNPERLISHRNTPEADNDIFNFTMTKEQTQAFNSVIFLNARTDGSITFASKERGLQQFAHIANIF